MKKFIFLAAASLVLLASCEKEKNNGPASTGVTGEWVADHVTLAFQHPDLTSIDLSVISPELGEIAISDIVAMGNEAINNGLNEDPSVSADLILTEDGNLIIDGLDVPITYTVDNSTLNVHVDQSVISGIAEQIKNEQDVMDILSLLGLSGLVENPQSVDLPLTSAERGSSPHIQRLRKLPVPDRGPEYRSPVHGDAGPRSGDSDRTAQLPHIRDVLSPAGKCRTGVGGYRDSREFPRDKTADT